MTPGRDSDIDYISGRDSDIDYISPVRPGHRSDRSPLGRCQQIQRPNKRSICCESVVRL